MSQRMVGQLLTITIAAIAVFFAGCSARSLDPSKINTGGFTVRKSGDLITCTAPTEAAAPGRQFEGIYSLDYLLSATKENLADEVDVQNWDESTARLGRIIAEKLPAALPRFQQYVSLIENQDPAKSMVWQPSDLALLHLPLPDLEQMPPANCLETVNGVVQPRITQMVVRKNIDTVSHQVHFLYDKAKFEQLKSNPALAKQLSFLLLHEWLWDLTDKVWVNLALNRLLHSKKIDSMSPEEFRTYLASLDIDVSSSGLMYPTSATEQHLRDAVSGNPACDWSARGNFEFFPDATRRVVPAHDRIKQRLNLAPQSGTSICAMALSIALDNQNPTATSTGNTRPIAIEMARGFANMKWQQDYNPTSGGILLKSVCMDSLCAKKAGELNDLLITPSYPSGPFDFVLDNSAGSTQLDLLRVTLTLVPTKKGL